MKIYVCIALLIASLFAIIIERQKNASLTELIEIQEEVIRLQERRIEQLKTFAK
jgi:tRNA(Ser,Leu) C12 N-acetylase TAN1